MTTGPTPDQRGWHVLLAGTLVSALGSGLTLPFLIVYLHDVRHLSLPLSGSLVALSALVGLGAGAAGGAAGDRVGVRATSVAGLAVSGIGTAALAAARSPALIALAVAVAGAGESLLWPALNTLVTDLVSEERRHRAYAVRFGVLNAGLGLGGLISGSVVSVQHPGSFQLVYLGDGATSLAFAVVIAVGLRHLARPASTTAEDRPASGGYREVLADRAFVAWLLCTALFVLFGYAQLDGAWAAFATGVVGVSPRIVGVAFAANTATIVVAQVWVAGRTTRWRRSRTLALVGLCWTAAWAVTGVADWSALAGTPADVALVASLAAFAVGETFLSPVVGAVPNELAPERLRARYNSLGTMAWAAGGLAGPPLAGVLLGDAHPVSWVAVIGVGTALAAAGGLWVGTRLPSAVDRPPEEVLVGT